MAIIALAIVNVCFTDVMSRGERIDSARRRDFTAGLAEGVSVRRHGYYGVDFIRCGNCRVEKQKLGVRGEAKRDGLHLEGCCVIDGLLTNFVGKALLTVKPELKVAWRGGEMRF